MPQSAFSALGMLAIAIGILVLAFWVTRALGTWQMKGSLGPVRLGGDGNIVLLNQVSLGRNERLVLVRVGQRCLLLGVTTENIAVLREFSEAEADELCRQPEKAHPAGFAEILKDSLRKRK